MISSTLIFNSFPIEASSEEMLCSLCFLSTALAAAKDKSSPPKVPEKESMGTATPVKTEGFSGLQSSAYGKEAPLDIFSKQTSGQNCAASPYSNSLGYLCLDKNAVGLLNTRGGNATGKDAQIGSP
jgi:hypothetical protein